MKHGSEMDGFDNQTLLRQYLLGMLSDESVRDRIEERLMIDDDHAALISAAEDELIEKFLDGELTAEESDRFNRFFLAAPERIRQLRLTRDLRRISAQTEIQAPHRQRSLTEHSHSWGWLRFSLVAAVLLIAAFTVWRFAIYKSDTDRGVEQLQAAYRDQRPVESRLAEFRSYAPYSETRGGVPVVSDPAALERADQYLLDAAADPNNAEAHRARSIFFAAKHDLDRAVRESEAALKAAPDDAQVQSDAGAVYYEAAKDVGADASKQLTLLNESLEHLDRAIELAPKMPEPRFNRALCLEAMTSIEQAKTAWHEYLDLDQNSRWSDEAKRHLQRLEASKPVDRSADQLESDFLAAVQNDDRSQAEKLLTESREAIREKYLPQRLAISFTLAEPDRRDELLAALDYSGKIELERTGDGYARDIARFYSTVNAKTLAVVRNAQQEVRDGYDHCKANEYELCLASFERARGLFINAGDEPEAHLVGYFIGYAQLNTEHHAEALATISDVAQYARERNYRWLEMTATHWVGGCLSALTKNTDALAAYERALSIARETNDSYAMDRNLMAMAEIESYSRQDSKALQYAFEALRLSSSPFTSRRQRYRDLSTALPIFSAAGLYHAARFVGLESIAAADRENNQMFMVHSRGFAAVAVQQSGDLKLARDLLHESRLVAESTSDERTRQKVVAFAKLRSGDVEYAAENYSTAEQFYADAAALYDAGIEIPVNREEAHIGALLSNLALGNSEKLAEQIPINIRLTEESRYGLRDESQRTGFFDSRVNVYDIASEFELSRANPEAAYDHAEASSSRSLLDHMLSGLDKVSSAEGERVLLRAGVAPLKLDEIRARMPAHAQIVQYSVFSDKLVIWVISRDDFESIAVPVRSSELTERVTAYAALVSRPNTDPEQEKAAARKLYDILIAPVRGQLAPDRELCIVPNRVLFEVPYSALLAPDGERLIKTFPIVFAPSANVFVSASLLALQKASLTSDESLLAVGDPSFDRTRHSGLQPLADAALEAKRISQMYSSSSVLVGETATKTAFLGSMNDADVVHFAGHYVSQPGSPMSSYLLMASRGNQPGSDELTDLELAGSRLSRTRVVVLAACDSGAETWYEGEGMIGAARSMLAAGVPLVVASQWAVDSAATSELMTRFHRLRREKHESTAAALRQAQAAMIDDVSLGYTSPYYWAGFGVFGGAADF